MKNLFNLKHLMILFISFTYLNSYSVPKKVLIEYCTGTWVGWSPCGDQSINSIQSLYPQTIAIAYHGGPSSVDPWKDFIGNQIIPLLGFSAYPTAVIDRKNTPSNPYITYEQWFNLVQTRYNSSPDSRINLVLTAKEFIQSTRQLFLTFNSTSLENLIGSYKISIVIVEDSLIHSQLSYLQCGSSGGYISNYIHNNVAREMINGPTGENLNSNSIWNMNQTIATNINTILDQTWIPQNCKIIAFVYKDSSILSLGNVEQAFQEKIINTFSHIRVNLKLIFEGMYFPLFNQMSRRDSITAYLNQSTPPYNKIDSAKALIDSISFSGLFNFINAPTGTYYISVKHFNTIETWSKTGGENLVNNGTLYNYNFTTSSSQAYGNNLKLKGGKYCLYSGDVNQSGFIDIDDFAIIDNDVYNFVEGLRVSSDLNGDRFVDQTDMAIGENNRFYIGVIRP